jgi:hypothetical protein
MRYRLTDHEWVAIKPMLPNEPRPDQDSTSWRKKRLPKRLKS